MAAADFLPHDAAVAGIKDVISRLEAERAAAQRRTRWLPFVAGFWLIVGVVALSLVFNVYADPAEQWFSPLHVFLYVGAFVLAYAVYYWTSRLDPSLRQSQRLAILSAAFGFLPEVRIGRGSKPSSFARMPREVAGDFDGESFDDVIAGRYEDFGFELYEARLTKGSGKSLDVAFKGVVVAFELVVPFPGVLVATRKLERQTGFLRGLFARSLEPVESGVAGLDASYAFLTDNPQAAQPLVTGQLPKALDWLAEAWPEEPARVALNGKDGFLLLPLRKNFFELPPATEPIDYTLHVEPMIADLSAMLATASLVRKIGADAQP
ncbi:DUF3137 domain-containing protein [Oryzicola mucosus]|uniref:DUF3137 domain-containing protein n=1 Tax=Oryzicola mucosus TaxID=2767425 RepID=A0A8J6PSW6_9HYPH|nr:DUF3137 domain-containing protein [Oryzicola mucosus]MBD0414569.1 DUF3137 domain-containing protein [Oryzicola mucosus]